MFDIGWQELFVVAILALIIVGPKDLPRAIRTGSAWIRKARKMGRELQAGVSEMVREAELEDVKEQLSAGKKLGTDLKNEVSRGLEFDELEFDEDEDKTILDSSGTEPGEVIDVVAQEVVKPLDEDESVMPIAGDKSVPEDMPEDANEQPIISLDDDVMPVVDKKPEPSQ